MTRPVLVCGDRHWTDGPFIARVIGRLPSDTTLVEGGARGADTLARRAAEARGIRMIEVRAEWETYGRAAGPIRNREMLALGPMRIIAFHDDLQRSRGTMNMIRQARATGIPVRLYHHRHATRSRP